MYKIFIPIIAKKAKKILTISNFSKLEIKEFLKVDSEVVYPRSIFSSIRFSKISKNKSYFIAVGSNNVRKNTEFLFMSLNSLNLDFRIVGRSSKNFKPCENIFFHNYNDEELIKAITKSKALISASLYEGFNLPPLEAQSLGVPVILSDIPVHREIYGDTALYFNLDSIDELEAAINKLNSKKYYFDFVRKGYLNARRFDDYRNNLNKLKKFGIEFSTQNKE
jgi:glycosyltransferase involved in cell wall biosynthesis